MTNEEFLSEFAHIAEAPNGIARLRRGVLDLAVRGCLVPQDPADEPASALLERIAEERKRLVKEKKIKAGKLLPDVDPKEVPYGLPPGWQWSRLGRVVDVVTGSLDANAAAEGGEFPFFTCSETALQIDSYAFDADAVLLSGNGNFHTRHYKGKFNAYQRVYVITSVAGKTTEVAYIHTFLRHYRELFHEASIGGVIKYLRLAMITEALLPFPPLAEQQRIVSRVDELMALCDELEEGQSKATELRAATARSTLATIVESDRAETDHAVELINNHVRLALSPGTGAAEVVEELRKAILDLAARGRLVPQNPADEPASVLLGRITEERERLVADKVIKKGKPLVGVTPDAEPYPLPAAWEWVTLEDITSQCRRGRSPSYQGGRTPVINQKCVRHGTKVDLTWTKLTNESANPLPEWAVVQEGDIFVNSTGAGTLGRVGWLREPIERTSLDSHVTLLRPIFSGLSDYLGWFLHSSEELLVSLGTGTTKQQELGSTALRGLRVSLPPLTEQQRIVTRVDELMGLCDELEEGLLAERRIAGEFAESAVAALVA